MMLPIELSKSIIVGIALATAGTGCTVQGRGAAYVDEPVGTVEVTSAPVVQYEAYPQAVYEGRTVYYVNNRWGYPHGQRWVYYRSEPPPLVRYRTRVQAAPPAPRAYPQPQPYSQPAPTPYTAPPATRTR